MTKKSIVLAPMRGITDVIYRNVFADCSGGVDRAIAPFVKLRRGQGLTDADRRRLDPKANEKITLIPQINTNHGLAFIDGVRELMDLGYDEINWNLGCPYPTVSKRRQGAGLLPHPTLIDDILTQVLKACSVKLSVKMRLGFHSPDEFTAVIEVLNDHPLTEVILHPRTATQMYAGEVDLERAELAFAQCTHPFVYNGDIVSLRSFDEISARFPTAAGWMLGRGLLANPLLALEMNGHSFTHDEKWSRVRAHHDALLSAYSAVSSGDKQTLIRMREHWAYLANGFDKPEVVFRRFKRCRTMEGYRIAVDRTFAEVAT